MGTQHCSSTWRGAHIWGVLAILHVPILGVCWGLEDKKKGSHTEYDLLKSAGEGWIPKDEGHNRCQVSYQLDLPEPRASYWVAFYHY